MTAAKKRIPLLKSAFFYTKVADVFGLLGTGGLITLDVNNANETWTWIVGCATGLVQFIRLIFVDSNRNNIPDILEEQEAELQQEVNITVKQDPEGGTPIVDVSQQTITTPTKP